MKKYDGEEVKAGNIIVRQRGTKFHAGTNAGLGKDYTLFALTDGFVKFETFGKGKKRVSICIIWLHRRQCQKAPRAAYTS